MGRYVGLVLEETDLSANFGGGSHGVARDNLYRDTCSLATFHSGGHVFTYGVADSGYALPFSVQGKTQRAHGFLLVG